MFARGWRTGVPHTITDANLNLQLKKCAGPQYILNISVTLKKVT